MIGGISSQYSSDLRTLGHLRKMMSPPASALRFGQDDKPSAPDAAPSPSPFAELNTAATEASKEPPKRRSWLTRLMIPVLGLGGVIGVASGISHIADKVQVAEQNRIDQEKQRRADYEASQIRYAQSELRQDLLTKVLPSIQGDDNKLKVLQAYVGDASPRVRVLVAENTRFFTDKDGDGHRLKILSALTADSNDEVRSAVARATANLTDPAVKLTLLKQMVKDPSANIRYNVAQSAETLPNDAMKGEIIKHLLKDENSSTRRIAISILENIKDDAVKQAIFQFSLGESSR